MQRIRLLLAAAAIALLGFVVLAQPASAEGKLSHPVEECIKQLEEANSIDVTCQEAPKPLVPEKNEIIWGAIGFLVVFGFIWKAGLPAIKAGMNARTERIRSDLDAAESQRTEATGILSEYQAQLADARTQSARIIEEARQAADEVRRSLTVRAEADIADMRTRATADIESAKVQAIADLRGEVANLAIGAAEQVVERSLDRDTNVALVESFINQVGANR